MLDSFKVEVILPAESEKDVAAVEACSIALNLLPRFLRNVRYTGPASMLQLFPKSHIAKIDTGTNNDWHASVSLVFGKQELPNAAKPVYYVYSSGWSTYISTEKPSDWSAPKKPNRLAAFYAGALAVGEVFKIVIEPVKTDNIVNLEYDLVTHGKAKQQPVLEPEVPDIIHFEDLIVVGCGAIGQALVHALTAFTSISGRISLVDCEALEPSNEQRYILAFEENRGHPKTGVLFNLLCKSNPGLGVTALGFQYEALASLMGEPKVSSEVVVAVDNIRTRLNIQAGLPKTLWNVWTDTAEGTLRYGVGKHSLQGPYQCLACSYFPSGDAPSQMRLTSIRTGLPEEEIRERLAKNDVCTQQDIERVARTTGLPLDRLTPNLGKSFHDLLHGDCGVFRMQIGEEHAVTPAPHTSVLAGIVLASQLILERMNNLPEPATLIESAADFDALRIPTANCLIPKLRNQRCFCTDLVYIDAYNRKWGISS